MNFHPDKCSVLPITKSKNTCPTHMTYTLHGHNLQEVSSTRYLGVTLQSDTWFSHHIDSMVTKANRTLAFLRRNLKIGSTQIYTDQGPIYTKRWSDRYWNTLAQSGTPTPRRIPPGLTQFRGGSHVLSSTGITTPQVWTN